MIKTQCSGCKKVFDRPLWHAKRKGKRYCSRDCQFPKVYIACFLCKKKRRISPSAKREKNFCSKSCSAKWGAKINPRKTRKNIFCTTCGKQFERQPNQIARVKHNYCSKKCFYERHKINMSGDKNPAWRGGYEPYYGSDWNVTSEQIRKRDKFRCVRCNLPQTLLTKKLHVHHIKPLRDFNRDFEKANAPENLVSLCPRCHKLLEWHEE